MVGTTVGLEYREIKIEPLQISHQLHAHELLYVIDVMPQEDNRK